MALELTHLLGALLTVALLLYLLRAMLGPASDRPRSS